MKQAIGMAEFRKSLRECFDKALKGDPVVVERGGVRYTLVCEVVAFQEPKGASAATAVKVDKVIKDVSLPYGVGVISREDANRIKKRPIEEVQLKDPIVELVPGGSDRFTGPLCKIHGFPLDDRGRCMQKGCKYA